MSDKKNINFAEYGLLIFSIFILILLLYLLASKVYISSLFSENTGLYFYSTLVQANAAIFSILSIFFIFRLQYVNSRITSIRQELISINNPIANRARLFFQMDLSRRQDFIDKFSGAIEIKELYQNAHHFLLNKQSLKSRLVIPASSLSLVVIIQSILLLLASAIHGAGYILEASFFLFTLITQIWSLLIIYKNIKLMI